MMEQLPDHPVIQRMERTGYPHRRKGGQWQMRQGVLLSGGSETDEVQPRSGVVQFHLIRPLRGHFPPQGEG